MEEIRQEVPWRCNGDRNVLTPEWAIGFVYVIAHKLLGREIVYVGKKMLHSTRRKRIGVREKAATKTRKTFKVEKKDSNWAEYWGSSKTLHVAREKGEGTWTRTIVQWCYSKKNLSYEECRWQMLMQVMNKPSYNDHIGNWYAQDIHIGVWRESQQKLKEKRENKNL